MSACQARLGRGLGVNPPEGTGCAWGALTRRGMEDSCDSRLPRKCGWPVLEELHRGARAGCAGRAVGAGGGTFIGHPDLERSVAGVGAVL